MKIVNYDPKPKTEFESSDNPDESMATCPESED